MISVRRELLLLLYILPFLVVSCGGSGREERVVLSAARLFRKEHIRDYVAKAEINKTVFSADSCIQHLYMSGLWGSFGYNQKKYRYYWDDSYQVSCFLPLRVRGTELRIPGSGIPLKDIYRPGGDGTHKGFLVHYVDDFDRNILLHVRALEVYGPLNPRQVRRFDYRFLDEHDGVQRIAFRTARGFPAKTKIFAEGNLLIGQDRRLVGLEVYDLEDRYTSFIRISVKHRMRRATKDTISVRYATREQGLWLSFVEQRIGWKNDIEDGKYYYYPEFAPWRNPFKNALYSRQTIQFSEPVAGLSTRQAWDSISPREKSFTSPQLCWVETDDSETGRLLDGVLAKEVSIRQVHCETEEELVREISRWKLAQKSAKKLEEELYLCP